MSYAIKSETLKNIADAIRAKTGKAGNILVSNFATEISSIPEAETEIFDGTIIIESNFTTISGSYLIDQKKAFDVLQALTTSKTFAVAFGAGGPPNGGDEMCYTSMTFDATNDCIGYNDIVAFTCVEYMNGGDGFVGYNSNGGTGDGARINFAEGTEVRKEFKELFLSIADDASLISFTIGGTTYKAEDGMTWEEWVDSEYNTAGFTCNGENSSVYNTEGTHYVSKTDGYVEGGVAIEANCAYNLVIVSGTN